MIITSSKMSWHVTVVTVCVGRLMLMDAQTWLILLVYLLFFAAYIAYAKKTETCSFIKSNQILFISDKNNKSIKDNKTVFKPTRRLSNDVCFKHDNMSVHAQ